MFLKKRNTWAAGRRAWLLPIRWGASLERGRWLLLWQCLSRLSWRKLLECRVKQAAYTSNDRDISVELRKQAHNCASETYQSKPLCPCGRDHILQSCFPMWQLSVVSWVAKKFCLVSSGSLGKWHLVGGRLSVLPIANSFIVVFIHQDEQ